MWQIIGDLFLCFLIVGALFLITYVNANYLPNSGDDNDKTVP